MRSSSVLGQRPKSSSARDHFVKRSSKHPGQPKKFLFSLPFFLAKGKKEEMNSLYTKNGCRISEIFP